MIIKNQVTRRKALRGFVGGGAITVGLPLLNCFLNTNGDAFASGEALPQVFGHYYYGLGLSPGQWEPKIVGPNYVMDRELAPLAAFRAKANVYSGLKVFLDGKPNAVHSSGPQTSIYGGLDITAASLDQLVSGQIGTRTRFRSIEVGCSNKRQTYSRAAGGTTNTAETSPVALYGRIFGAEFKDPNAAEFTPDPAMIARKSALSGVSEQRQALMAGLGADDRRRLDEYFTSLRQLEQQIALSLEKPTPMPNCAVPQKGEDIAESTVIEDVQARTKLFSGLVAHALACGQTQVFNMLYSQPGSADTRHAGSGETHHALTHEEGRGTLGYQPQVSWFNAKSIEGIAILAGALDSIKEGDRTLLDRSLIYASTDVGMASVHALDNIAVITVGGANGKMKTGIHVAAVGETITRVGLTIQHAVGLRVAQWGTQSNQATKEFSEVLA